MSAKANLLDHDLLATTRELPDDLIRDIPVLMVNRKGRTAESYMRTENFIGHAVPGRTYELSLAGMEEVVGEEPAPLPKATVPPHVKLAGEWIAEVDLTIEEANILGGNGRYLLPEGEGELVIPVADCTAENLAFYDSPLVKLGEVLRFEATGNLPVTITSVGRDYGSDYLVQPELGGGAYLEIHDRPHFHMPMDPEAGGHLILGKRMENGDQLVSAFRIPFGYGVHMAPWAIHCDAYLEGRYMVIYSATPEFSTVIVRKRNGELAEIRFS